AGTPPPRSWPSAPFAPSTGSGPRDSTPSTTCSALDIPYSTEGPSPPPTTTAPVVPALAGAGPPVPNAGPLRGVASDLRRDVAQRRPTPFFGPRPRRGLRRVTAAPRARRAVRADQP